MGVYAEVSKIALDAIFGVALLTAGAYAKWHLWWQTGFGRARMVLLLSIAAITLDRAAPGWTRLRPGTIPSEALNWSRLGANIAVLGWLVYMLYATVAMNIRRVRDPDFAVSQGRRHLSRTPWATQAEIEKLTACWEEGRTRHHPD